MFALVRYLLLSSFYIVQIKIISPSERSSICVLGISISLCCISTICRLDFGTVPIVWHLFVCSYYYMWFWNRSDSVAFVCLFILLHVIIQIMNIDKTNEGNGSPRFYSYMYLLIMDAHFFAYCSWFDALFSSQ
jgi:hypothetical protein